LNIREVGFYGGGVVGDVTVDGAGGNAVKAKISASSVRLLPFLKALADLTAIEGFGRVEMDVAGGGASLHDIMNSLDGTGAISLTDGALVGYNLAEMVRNVKGAFGGGADGPQKTDFAEIAGTFAIRDGVMTNDDFRFLGPLIRIVGQGEIDLGDQSMRFRLTPKAVTSLEGQGGSVDAKGLAFPLIVTGPWANLSIRPDLESGLLDVLKDPEGALKAIEDVSKGVGGLDGLKDGAVDGALDQLKDGGALEQIAPGAGGAAGAILNEVLGGGKKQEPAAPAPEAKAPATETPAAEPKKKRSEMTPEERKAERKRKRQERRAAERAAAEEAARKAEEEKAGQTPEGQIKSLIDGVLRSQ
ncbi:MAG: AsmA-like C-terminal region-containing protein, partial [Pseudomonadota bacterium]